MSDKFYNFCINCNKPVSEGGGIIQSQLKLKPNSKSIPSSGQNENRVKITIGDAIHYIYGLSVKDLAQDEYSSFDLSENVALCSQCLLPFEQIYNAHRAFNKVSTADSVLQTALNKWSRGSYIKTESETDYQNQNEIAQDDPFQTFNFEFDTNITEDVDVKLFDPLFIEEMNTEDVSELNVEQESYQDSDQSDVNWNSEDGTVADVNSTPMRHGSWKSQNEESDGDPLDCQKNDPETESGKSKKSSNNILLNISNSGVEEMKTSSSSSVPQMSSKAPPDPSNLSPVTSRKQPAVRCYPPKIQAMNKGAKKLDVLILRKETDFGKVCPTVKEVGMSSCALKLRQYLTENPDSPVTVSNKSNLDKRTVVVPITKSKAKGLAFPEIETNGRVQHLIIGGVRSRRHLHCSRRKTPLHPKSEEPDFLFEFGHVKYLICCEVRFSSKVDYFAHRRQNHNGESLKEMCTECGRLISYENMNVHMQEHHRCYQFGIKAFGCLFCNKLYKEEQKLLQHLHVTNGNEYELLKSVTGAILEMPSSTFVVSQSNKNNQIDADKEPVKRNINEISCSSYKTESIVDKIFKDMPFSSVVKTSTKGVEPLCKTDSCICWFCGKTMLAGALSSHIINTPTCSQGLYQCEHCDKAYKLSQSLHLHKLSHDKTHTGVVCDICGKLVNHLMALQSHMRDYHSNTELSCTKCDKTFEHRRTWQLHKEMHENGPYVCDQCGKVIATRSEWLLHKDAHENGPFVCDQCGISSKSRPQFQMHLRKHKDEGLDRELFKCKECGKYLKDTFSLKKHHTRFHREDLKKIFSCPTCGKTTRNMTNMRIHQRVHDPTRIVKRSPYRKPANGGGRSVKNHKNPNK